MKEIQGDILTPVTDGTPTVVCHQVNCTGVMGAGLAKQIKDRFPEVFRVYKERCSIWRQNPQANLGHVQFCSILGGDGYIIANIFGQLYYGTGKRQTDYDALRDGLRRVSEAFSNATIRIPYGMGCGLGGGDWDIVLGIIQDELVSKGRNVEIWRLG